MPTLSVTLDPGDEWKTYRQLETDLTSIIDAGYSKVCLFDLRTIWGYPDSRYIPLLKKYADAGLDITVYVKDVGVDTSTLGVVRSIGASSVIVYEEDLIRLFRDAGIKVEWWSLVGYPDNNMNRPLYMGWPDLRNDQLRQDLAHWAVQVPDQVDGGLSLDYIRWNEVGNGRSADQVTDLVQQIRSNWNALGRGTLSAAVYPYLGDDPSEGGGLSVGQKWNDWLKDDLLDFVYPMAYDSEDIPRLIGVWRAYPKNKIVPCLSVVTYK